MASNYIDRVIFVGVPQFGTPQDIAAMLHGDGETYASGLVLYGGTTRQVTRNMPGLYALLPSSAYFSGAENPLALFTTGGLTTPYAMHTARALRATVRSSNFLAIPRE